MGSFILLIKSISRLIKISSFVNFRSFACSFSNICLSNSLILFSIIDISALYSSRVNASLIYAFLTRSFFISWTFNSFDSSSLGLVNLLFNIGKKKLFTTESYSKISLNKCNIDSSILSSLILFLQVSQP